MLFVCLAVATLAVARITRLLVEDQLAYRYRRWVVRRFGEDSLPAYLVHCPWCTSIYVALAVMPPAVFWPGRLTLAVLSVPAASLLTGLILDRK